MTTFHSYKPTTNVFFSPARLLRQRAVRARPVHQDRGEVLSQGALGGGQDPHLGPGGCGSGHRRLHRRLRRGGHSGQEEEG